MAAPQVVNVNIGDLGMYSGGAFIPDGDYVMFFNVVQHQATDKTTGQNKGASRLGVMVDFFPMSSPDEDHKITQFYSMGTKADQSFAPNPETGKGIVPIAGAKGASLSDKTNWFMLINSLIQSGLPQGVFSGDFTTLDGVWGHITNVDEPAERATMHSNTSEVQQEGPRKPNKIAVVSEILEGGSPWEGGGGIPTVAAAKPNGKPASAKAPVAAKATVKAPAKPTPVPEADEDIKSIALSAISDVITKKPLGVARLALRTETFKLVTKSAGEEAANSVISTFFEPAGEALLLGILGELGYTIQGPMVKPTA